jgi:DNA-binding transcriptional LysR family regulator
VRELVAQGLGVTIMPASVVAGAADVTVVVRPLRPRTRVPVSLLWRAHEAPTPAARAFRDQVVAAVDAAGR